MTTDPALSALLDDVVRAVDEDITDDPGCPDLAAVMARAHELDPQRVPAEVVREVANWAPVVSIQQGHRRRQTRDDLELMAVIDGVRAHVEEDVAQRLGHPPPLGDSQTPGSSKPRRVWVAVLAVAAVLLIVGAGVLQASRWMPQRDEASHNEAALIEQEQPAVAPDRHAVPREPPASAVPPGPEPPPAADDLEAEAPLPEVEAPDRRRPGKRRPTMTLEQLDAAAHAAWRAGDLAGAERLFHRLARRAGKGRLGDLAYGDLFTLARQTNKPGKEVKLWRSYLRRFPDGRFADDARAGLCRRASGDKQRACWQRYLADMPGGSHRAQAQRALSRTGGSP